MLTENFPKEVRRWVQRVRMPSGTCQACLSDKSPDKDFMITCDLCQSSIHYKHYGREIDESQQAAYDKWRCERCRVLCQLASQGRGGELQLPRCHFCPSSKGILKRVIYNGSDTIWLHPECSTWPYPIIYQKNNRRIHYNCEYPIRPTGRFWVNFQPQQSAACTICNQSVGYKIKCMYYTCQKYYHCSCAKTVGIIRDLESMHFENCDTYIPPYCEEHLEKRIWDCGVKAKKYRGLKDEGKASHFNQMLAAYTTQLRNLQKSAKKFKEEELIRLQMEYQAGDKEDVLEELSFDEPESYRSAHSPSFYNYIFDREFPSAPARKPALPTRLPLPREIPLPDPLPRNEVQVDMGVLLRAVNKHNPNRFSERESQEEESEWNDEDSLEDEESE